MSFYYLGMVANISEHCFYQDFFFTHYKYSKLIQNAASLGIKQLKITTTA